MRLHKANDHTVNKREERQDTRQNILSSFSIFTLDQIHYKFLLLITGDCHLL